MSRRSRGDWTLLLLLYKIFVDEVMPVCGSDAAGPRRTTPSALFTSIKTFFVTLYRDFTDTELYAFVNKTC